MFAVHRAYEAPGVPLKFTRLALFSQLSPQGLIANA